MRDTITPTEFEALITTLVFAVHFDSCTALRWLICLSIWAARRYGKNKTRTWRACHSMCRLLAQREHLSYLVEFARQMRKLMAVSSGGAERLYCVP